MCIHVWICHGYGKCIYTQALLRHLCVCIAVLVTYATEGTLPTPERGCSRVCTVLQGERLILTWLQQTVESVSCLFHCVKWPRGAVPEAAAHAGTVLMGLVSEALGSQHSRAWGWPHRSDISMASAHHRKQASYVNLRNEAELSSESYIYCTTRIFKEAAWNLG